MNSKIIAVDFDGTLCENKWPEIGEAPAGVFSKMFGIVEFSDGVRRVDPSEIVFCDEENEILSEMEKMRK